MKAADKMKTQMQMKQASINSTVGEAKNLITLFSFYIVGILVLSMLIYIHILWQARPSLTVAQTGFVLPKFIDVFENMKLVFQGFKDGYFRTILGYCLFLVFSASFIACGNMAFKFIWKNGT